MFKTKHISGINNGIADALSRYDFQRFRLLAPAADELPATVPTHLLDIFSK
jgi:hypothetical protein